MERSHPYAEPQSPRAIGEQSPPFRRFLQPFLDRAFSRSGDTDHNPSDLHDAAARTRPVIQAEPDQSGIR